MDTSDWVALNSDWPTLLVVGLSAVIVLAVWRQRPHRRRRRRPQDRTLSGLV